MNAQKHVLHLHQQPPSFARACARSSCVGGVLCILGMNASTSASRAHRTLRPSVFARRSTVRKKGSHAHRYMQIMSVVFTFDSKFSNHGSAYNGISDFYRVPSAVHRRAQPAFAGRYSWRYSVDRTLSDSAGLFSRFGGCGHWRCFIHRCVRPTSNGSALIRPTL